MYCMAYLVPFGEEWCNAGATVSRCSMCLLQRISWHIHAVTQVHSRATTIKRLPVVLLFLRACGNFASDSLS